MRMILLLSVLLFGGCSMKEAPVMKEYTLLTPSVSAVSNTYYRNKILKVSYPVAMKQKLSDKMYFSYSFSDSGAYLNSRWSNDMGKMLQGDVIQTLSQARLFRVVVPFASDVEENFRLECTVFDFSHHVREESSYAIVSLQFTLMNAETGTLVKARRFSYREHTTTTDARGYAEATSRIMVKLSHDLINWLR